jgi:hypothetical protein
MKSFAFAIEPAPQPRLAGGLLLLHAAIAVMPWLTRCPPTLALALTALTAIDLARCIGQVPGQHCRLQAAAVEPAGWRVRIAGVPGWQAAALGPASRAFAQGVLLELRSGGRRLAWLLPRRALPAAEFRRLKARIRLTC